METCGACLPCKAGQPRGCVRVLRLDAKDLARLAKLYRIVGERPSHQHASLFPRRELALAPVREKPEPMSEVACSGCGGKFQMQTFLVEFVRQYKSYPLKCESCREGRQTRMDLDDD